MKYEIQGNTLPVVLCYLENGETMVTEGGAMSWMSPNMQMETTSGGGFGKMFGRMLAGESLFLNRYTSSGEGMIAFAAKFPGQIKAFEIGPGKEYIFQKKAFLAGEEGIDITTYFQKKAAAGFFGGEGFVLQKISGQGVAFAEFDGHTVEYDLAAGQKIVVDSGHLAAMEATCSMDIQTVPGIKNALLGGEGLFNTVITGPGRVWLQTMPIANLAQAIIPYIPQKSN